MTKYKWIRVQEDLYNDISALGKFNESFGQLLRRLVDSYKDNNSQRQHQDGQKQVLKKKKSLTTN